MEGSKKSVILKTVGICAVVAVVGTAAVLVPVLVANKKNDQATQEEVLNYGDVQVSTNGSTATLNGADGQTIKDGDNDAVFLSSDGSAFGASLAAGSSYTVTNPNFTPKKGTSSYYMRAKLVYYGVKDGALTEVDPDAYFEVKPTFGASWLESRDGYYYNVNAGETWAASDNISKLHINQATDEANGEDVYLFNDNPTYTVATGVEMQYDRLAVEVKVQVAENEAQINQLGWLFKNPLVKDLRLIFNVGEGSPVATLEHNTEEDVVSLANYTSTRLGYNFTGWKLGTATVTSVTFEKEDITVTADWALKDLSLTYDLDGGQGNIADTAAHHLNDEVTLTAEEPTRDGYTFGGWLLGDNVVTSVTFGGENITVKAKWVAIDYTLSYDLDEGEGEIVDTKVYHIGDTAQLSSVVPTKEGYTFAGWLVNDQIATQVTFGAGNITVTAKWIKNLTLALELGDDFVELETVYHLGDTVNLTELDTPTREGYRFNCWTLDGETKVTSVTFEAEEAIVITAKWDKQLKVIYGLNGGTGNIKDETIYYVGDTFELTEEEPTKENYRFLYWSFDGETELPEEYDFTFATEANIILNAVWEYWPTSGVRIHALEDYFDEYYPSIDGRNEDEDDKYQLTVSLADFEEPYEEAIDANVGYRLRYAIGSADGEFLPYHEENITAEAEIIELYPVWEKAMKVTFVVDGEEDTYGYGFAGQQITLPTPTGDGSLYWEDEDGEVYTGMTIFVTEDNQGSELTLTAKWSQTSSVTFSVNGISNSPESVLNNTFRLPTKQTVQTTSNINGIIVGWRAIRTVESENNFAYKVVSVNTGLGEVTISHTIGEVLYTTTLSWSDLYKDPANTEQYTSAAEIQENDDVYYAGVLSFTSQGSFDPGASFALSGDTTFEAVILNVTFDRGNYGAYIGSNSNYPATAIVNGQLKLPEFYFGISNNDYYFIGWENDRTEELALPGALVDYQDGDQFTAKYEHRKYVIDLDGGTFDNESGNPLSTEGYIYYYNSDINISIYSRRDRKVVNGQVYRVAGWEVESDVDEELMVEFRYDQIRVRRQDYQSLQSNVITFKALWAPIGTASIEFEVEDGVTVIDQATGLEANITYEVAENENYDYYTYQRLMIGNELEVRGKEGYLPIFTAYTKEGHNVLEGDPTLWANLAMDNMCAVPGGIVVKVDFEKAYDIEVKKGGIKVEDPVTHDMVDIPIQGEIVHLKYGEINNLEYALFTANIPYKANGWMISMTDMPAFYSVATNEEWNWGEPENLYMVPNWVNIGIDPGSIVVNGREIKGQFTKMPFVMQEGASLMIGQYNLAADGMVTISAEIPGYPGYQVAGYELDGEVYSMMNPYSGYYLLSGTKTDGIRFIEHQSMFGSRSYELATYEDGQLVESKTYETYTNGSLWLVNEDGERLVGDTYYYYNYSDEYSTRRNNIQVIESYNLRGLRESDNHRYYAVEKTGDFIQKPTYNNGISYVEDTDHGSWYYYEVTGGRVYTTSYSDYSGTLYFLASGENFDNKVELRRDYLNNYFENAYSQLNGEVYVYTNTETGEVVGYKSSYNSYQFYTETTDTTMPIYKVLGEGVDEDDVTMDCIGKTFTVVWEKAYDILDGEGYTEGVAEDAEGYNALIAKANAAIQSSIIPNIYNDHSNTIVSGSLGTMTYEQFMNSGEMAFMLTQNLDTLLAEMGEDITGAARIKLDTEDNAIVVKKGESGMQLKIVMLLDENDHITKYTLAEMIGDVAISFTFNFSGTVFYEPQEMATTVSYGDPTFDEDLVVMERDLWLFDMGAKLEPLGEVTQDNQGELLNQRVKFNEDVEFESASGDAELKGAFQVTAVDLENHTATVTYFENGYEWTAELNAGQIGVDEITADLVGEIFRLTNSAQFSAVDTLDETTTNITVDSIDGNDITLRHQVPYGQYNNYTFYATVGVADLDGVASVEDLNNGDTVTLVGDVDFTATKSFYTDIAQPIPQVLSIDTENEIIRIGGVNNGIRYYADVEIDDILGVDDIEELEIGQDVYLAHNIAIHAFVTVKANGFIDIGYIHGQYQLLFTPYITAVDPQEQTVTLSIMNSFTATVSLDMIEGIYGEMDEEDYPKVATTQTRYYNGYEMTQTEFEFNDDIFEYMSSNVITGFMEHPDHFAGVEATISYSADKTEYRAHLEAYEPGFEVISVDEENETVVVYQAAFASYPYGYCAEIPFENILTNAEEITEDLVGESVAVRGDFTAKMMFKSYDGWIWNVEDIDTENGIVTLRGEGIVAKVTLEQLKDIGSLDDLNINDSVHTQGMVDMYILELGVHNVEVVSVDTENETATLKASVTSQGQTFTFTAVVELDDLDGVEEITAELVGQTVTLAHNVLWSFDDSVVEDQKQVIDYIFRFDENGRVVGVKLSAKSSEGKQNMGTYFYYPVEEETEEPEVNPEP